MSSPVATVGLTYDGQDLQGADLQIFLEIRRGLNEPPSVRGRDSVVPARAGRVERNRVNDVLQIELVGMVSSDPVETDPEAAKASYRVNAQAVRALFAPNRARATLLASLEDGTSRSIEARPVNAIWAERVPGLLASVSIQLEGDGDWEAGS